jgi:hypothetical protein
VPSFENALRRINDLKAARIIDDYAIAGAMALVFWIEPIPTFDLDVLVLLPESDGPLVSLDAIYRWAAERSYPVEHEHIIIIEGVPVQFLPANGALGHEAIRTAVARRYEDVDIAVVRPEYLIALFLLPSARTMKRRERAAALRESDAVDRDLLDDVMNRFKLTF